MSLGDNESQRFFHYSISNFLYLLKVFNFAREICAISTEKFNQILESRINNNLKNQSSCLTYFERYLLLFFKYAPIISIHNLNVIVYFKFNWFSFVLLYMSNINKIFYNVNTDQVYRIIF